MFVQMLIFVSTEKNEEIPLLIQSSSIGLTKNFFFLRVLEYNVSNYIKISQPE